MDDFVVGVGRMTKKGLKTFNLRHSTIEIVKRKHNQSEFVDRAINKLHNDDSFNITDMPLKGIMWALTQRDDCPSVVRAVIFDTMGWKE